MRAPQLITIALALLLLLVAANLVVGKGSLPYVMSLEAQLREQLAHNQAARARNARLAAEVADLHEGLEMVEERARAELGMVKPDEVLVQVAGEAR
jgi:cell division protein FtsB